MSWQKERKRMPFEVKAVDLKGSRFEGYSAGIGNRDSYDDIIEPGAFDKTIEERVSAGKVKFLDQHRTDTTKRLWGDVVEAREEAVEFGTPPETPSHRIWTLFRVSQGDPDAQVALFKINEGILDGLSIGFVPKVVEFTLDDEDDDMDPQIAWIYGDGVRHIRELAWWETSAVIWGANDAALTIPGTVKDTLGTAFRASMEGVEADADMVRNTLVQMKTLMVQARENPAALRALGYGPDNLARSLDPFVKCADGVCELTDAGKAASYLLDNIVDAAKDATVTETLGAVVEVDVDVKEMETDDEDCGCGKDAEPVDGAQEDVGDDPLDSLRAEIEHLRATVDALKSDQKDTPGDEAGVESTEKDADAPDEVAEPESADADGLDERQDEADGGDEEVAGETRNDAEDSDERPMSREALEREITGLSLLELDLI